MKEVKSPRKPLIYYYGIVLLVLLLFNLLVTPLLFIRSFFSWSLVFVAIIILIRWEITFSKNPERFWRGSNLNLRCEHCTDKICKIKKPILQKGDKQP